MKSNKQTTPNVCFIPLYKHLIPVYPDGKPIPFLHLLPTVLREFVETFIGQRHEGCGVSPVVWPGDKDDTIVIKEAGRGHQAGRLFFISVSIRVENKKYKDLPRLSVEVMEDKERGLFKIWFRTDYNGTYVNHSMVEYMSNCFSKEQKKEALARALVDVDYFFMERIPPRNQKPNYI